MADPTLVKLTDLIASAESLELRRAAVQVAGSVARPKDKPVVKALLAAIEDADPEVRLAAIESLGRLEAEAALPALEKLVQAAGGEVEAATAAAMRLGPRGLKAMGKIMDHAAPALRSRMAPVLAKSGTGGGLVVTAHALLDPDPKVVDAAARSLATEVPSFQPAQKQALAKFLFDALKAKKKSLPPRTEAALLRVLGTLHHAKAEDIFWGRIGPDHPADIRAAALQALGNQSAKVNDARFAKLLAGAVDTDFQVVAHALMILKGVAAGAKNVKHWLKLLDAPDVATRRFAVEKLRGVESAEAARGLVAQLQHPDRSLHDGALASLLSFSKGRQALLDRLAESETADDAWSLARALAPAAEEITTAQRNKLGDLAFRWQDKEDRRAAALWFLLKTANASWTRGRVEAKAMALRKKKKYPEALVYLRLLAQDPALGDDVRFELASTGLKLADHNLSVEARQSEPSLIQFARLLQNPSFNLLKKVAQAKWLEPPDLFYLGFHFVEQNHSAREFGGKVLELVADRSPTSEIGKNARKKLKGAGLD